MSESGVVYVGKLSSSLTERELRRAFGSYG
jgi:hypothetical protein